MPSGRILSRRKEMDAQEKAAILNPDIKEISYGKKELKKLTIYPLSVGDQFQVTNMVTLIAKSLVAYEGQTKDLAFMTAVMTSLEDNLGKILGLVADLPEAEGKKIINDLTNSQLADIVEIVWTTSYESALKKGKSLYEKGKKVFLSERPLPDSSSPIPSID
jgi:hypothetical protein